jgi:hypothetical protein
MGTKVQAKPSALTVAEQVAYAANPLLGLIVEYTAKAVAKSNDIAESGEIDAIRQEAQHQEVALRLAEGQARVAQEIAIARRIEGAEEVEIEEFYDYSGEAHAGMKTDGSMVTVGLGAAGKRVSKRIYKFKGFASNRFDSSTVSAPSVSREADD